MTAGAVWLPGAVRLAQPWFLLLLLAVPAAWFLLWKQRGRRRAVRYSNWTAAFRLGQSAAQKWRYLLLALVCLVAALARPQVESRQVDRRVQGIDIVLVLDISQSMRAADIRPNRLAAAKKILGKFIRRRETDRLGLVVLGGTSFTLVPLTTDHAALVESLQEVQPRMIQIPGTALGDGILTAVNRLTAAAGPQPASTNSASSGAKSKVIILATDGAANRGVNPANAARLAAERGIRVYTVGIGSRRLTPRLEYEEGGRLVRQKDNFGHTLYWEQLDEKALRRIAELGHGRYFRAGSYEDFERVMLEIDRLEKGRVLLHRNLQFQERYAWPLSLALLLLLLEGVLAKTRFRSLAW